MRVSRENKQKRLWRGCKEVFYESESFYQKRSENLGIVLSYLFLCVVSGPLWFEHLKNNRKLGFYIESTYANVLQVLWICIILIWIRIRGSGSGKSGSGSDYGSGADLNSKKIPPFCLIFFNQKCKTYSKAMIFFSLFISL